MAFGSLPTSFSVELDFNNICMSNEERIIIVHNNTTYSYQRQRNKLVNYPLRSGPLRACKSFPTRYVLAFVQNLVENGQKIFCIFS